MLWKGEVGRSQQWFSRERDRSLPSSSSSHTLTTLQLDTMLQAEHGMFRMQPQEKTQEDFKFWSTQPMLRLGTK